MENSRVSIVLTSYRRPALVREAIASALGQTYREIELLVVDDNSGQETLDAIDQAIRRYAPWQGPPVVLLQTGVPEQERLSMCRYAVAINYALEHATGDLVTYLTDDDRYLPHRVARMVEELRDPGKMIVYGDQLVVDIDGAGKETTRGPRGTVGVTRAPQCRVDHCSVMHRRSCLDRLVRPWWPEGQENWGAGDAAFWGKLVEHWPFYPIQEVLDVHRWSVNNVQSRMIAGKSPIYA